MGDNNNEGLPEVINGLSTVAEGTNENSGEDNGAEEGVAVSLPVNASTAATAAKTGLAANALSKTGKTKKAKKVYSPTTQAKINARSAAAKKTKEGANYIEKQAKKAAEREEKEKKTLEQYGKLLYGVMINGEKVLDPTKEQLKNPAVQVATALELKRITEIWDTLLLENAGATLREAIAAYKAQVAAKPKREKLGSTEKENRKTIRRKMRLAGINPSMARLTAYRTKRANFNNINFKYNKNNTEKNRETKKQARTNLFTFLKPSESPELKGRRKVKANAKAALETYRVDAEKELKLLRTEAQKKKDAGVNPASITHLAMLRQAGYKIKATDFKELSTLVKKEKFTELKDHAVMKSLFAQAATKDACDRCILNTVFLVHVK